MGIISDKLWRKNFAADPGVVGKDLSLNGESFTIVGVLPPDIHNLFPSYELWTPLVFTSNQLTDRGSHSR